MLHLGSLPPPPRPVAWFAGREQTKGPIENSSRMPVNVSTPPATTVPPGPSAWLTGREHNGEAIGDAFVRELQDLSKSPELTVQDDEKILVGELRSKLCFWGDRSDETVLVQLSEETELPEQNSVEVVEKKEHDKLHGSSWLADKEDHGRLINHVQQYTHNTSIDKEMKGSSESKWRQTERKVKGGAHNVRLKDRVDFGMEETSGKGREGNEVIDLYAPTMLATRDIGQGSSRRKDLRFEDVLKQDFVSKKNQETMKVPNNHRARRFWESFWDQFSRDSLSHSAWLAGRGIGDVSRSFYDTRVNGIEM